MVRPPSAAIGAWWDPIVALVLSHEPFRRDPSGIMQGARLRRYPFFRRVGAFGVTESSPADARALAELAMALSCGRSDRMLLVLDASGPPSGDVRGER